MDENPYKAPQTEGTTGPVWWDDNLPWLKWLALLVFAVVGFLLIALFV